MHKLHFKTKEIFAFRGNALAPERCIFHFATPPSTQKSTKYKQLLIPRLNGRTDGWEEGVLNLLSSLL